MSILPRVALIGRPNVGKSTLYNRLIGKRQAVVAKIAGTTRDRLEGLVQWEGRQFILVDMAGLEPSLSEDTEISRGTQAQVLRALADAEAIVWVVDVREGVTLADQQIGEMLHKLSKNVLIATNKADHTKHDIDMYEFSRFGFETIVPVSALNGRS
jgi:GTP-binding protein